MKYYIEIIIIIKSCDHAAWQLAFMTVTVIIATYSIDTGVLMIHNDTIGNHNARNDLI